MTTLELVQDLSLVNGVPVVLSTVIAERFDKQHKHVLEAIRKLINDLPEQQRLIIQMRDIEQFEFAEMAKILEMNETAIRVALSRARKTIREIMTKTHHYGIG